MLPFMTVVLNQAIEADDETDVRNAIEVFENLLIVVCRPEKMPNFVRSPHCCPKTSGIYYSSLLAFARTEKSMPPIGIWPCHL